jgi:UDP-glucose 4-epimerase
MKTNLLITGGAGYIGSHAVKFFLEKGYAVTVFDNLSRGYKKPIEILKKYGRLNFIEGDLKNKKDLAKVFNKNKFEAVIHFAALCSVDESMKKPELYFENNVLGTLNLLEAMQKAGIKNIIFSSTCATYGETQYLPVDESHPQNPANPYGESKLMAEKIIEWFGKLHNFKFIILRYFNVCGADKNGIIGDSKRPSSLLMQNTVKGAMKLENFYYTCQKVDTPDGTPIRDYIDVEDLARAHFLALQYLAKTKKSDVFNLGNGKGFSVKEIVSEVEKTFGIKIRKIKGKTRKGEYAKIFTDTQKARKVLKYKTSKNLTDSIESLRKWYEKYPEGYKNNKSQ